MNLTSTVNITAPSQIPVGHGKSGTEEKKKNILLEQAQIPCCSEGKNILLINIRTESWLSEKDYINSRLCTLFKQYWRKPKVSLLSTKNTIQK